MAGVVGAVVIIVGLYLASVQNTRNRKANEYRLSQCIFRLNTGTVIGPNRLILN